MLDNYCQVIFLIWQKSCILNSIDILVYLDVRYVGFFLIKSMFFITFKRCDLYFKKII
jgi:hypothetical protein